MIHNPTKNPSTINIGQASLYPQEKLMEIARDRCQLIIGIPKEIDENETRIALTPQGVNLIVEAGHKVVFESGAGSAAKYSNQDYSEAGAEITDSISEVYQSDIVVKILPPTHEEARRLKERSTLFSMLSLTNLAKEALLVMMDKKVTLISLDMLLDESENFCVVRSLSEIEGIASVVVATHLLSNATYGKGVMLGGITGITPSEVLILGAGTAATVAARAALGMGATVKIFDHSLFKLREIVSNLGQHVFTSNLHPKVLAKAIKSADVVIGTMRYLNGSKRFMLSEELIKLMKPGTVLVDLSVDQGGCFETTHPTTIKKPTFEKYGVIHHCLPSISVLFGRSATIAFSNIVSALLLDIYQMNGVAHSIREDKGIRNGVVLFSGILTNHYVGQHFDIPSKDISLLLAAF